LPFGGFGWFVCGYVSLGVGDDLFFAVARGCFGVQGYGRRALRPFQSSLLMPGCGGKSWGDWVTFWCVSSIYSRLFGYLADYVKVLYTLDLFIRVFGWAWGSHSASTPVYHRICLCNADHLPSDTWGHSNLLFQGIGRVLAGGQLHGRLHIQRGLSRLFQCLGVGACTHG
jgi:hypothetical protein